MAAAYAFGPYHQYASRAKPGGYQHLVAQNVARTAAEDETVPFYVSMNDVSAILLFSPLPWDSERMGTDCYRIELYVAGGGAQQQALAARKIIHQAIIQCGEKQLHYLSARVNCAELPVVHALEDEGFLMMDCLLTLACWPPYSDELRITPGTSIRVCSEDDIEQVKTIARSAFLVDRFHVDPRISKETADELYVTWAEACCRGHLE
ncbi:MAG: hypothetical protein M3P18_18270, partial [Actinomycetota bacterium]|nr:hypothetical protein [Actinomycetota bacterium]